MTHNVFQKDGVNRLSLLLIGLIMAGLNSIAQASDEKELEALLLLLDKETAVATKTKMNADYVPGMVTILQGEQLSQQGVSSVAQALDKVAGFKSTLNNAGGYVSIVRGVGASLNGNNLKVLVNGIPANRAVDASADWVMRLPVSQIDRIEVIRGPGASIYGEFAFSGVVNVVTKKASEVAVSIAIHDRYQQDFAFNHQFQSGLNGFVNLSHWQQQRSGEKTDIDNFTRHDRGNAPGYIYDENQGLVLVTGFDYDSYQLQLQYSNLERGASYGKNAAMSEAREPRNEETLNIQWDKRWSFGTDSDLTLTLGFSQSELQHAAYLPLPAFVDPPGPMPPFPEDRYRQDINKDQSQRASLAWQWQAIDAHQLLFSLAYVESKVLDSQIIFSSFNQGYSVGDADQALVLDGAERRLYSVTLQDQWALSPKLELTLGARYDDYDDWGSTVSPRLASVWRADDHHLLKFQYAEAFRPPSLADQNPGLNTFPGVIYTPLSEETTDTTELAYIFNGTNQKFSSTLFYTHIHHLIEFYIQPGSPPRWRNRGDIKTTGIELEWQKKINRDWQLNTSVAYADAQDQRDRDKDLTGSIMWLAAMGLSWDYNQNLSHNVTVNYTGEQEGYDNLNNTPMQQFDAYTTVDYSVTLKHAFSVSGLTLTAAINNVTDRRYAVMPNPAQYPNGLPLGDRNAWLPVSYSYQ